MYRQYLLIIFLTSLVSVMSVSCVNTRQSTYFNDAKDADILAKTEDSVAVRIQKNDILSISITSLNAEASAIFNSNNTSTIATTSTGSSQTNGGYLVNTDGMVQLPILGNIKVEGLTIKEIKQIITNTILEKKLLIDPIVTIRHLNFEVTVIGEVGKPTVISVPNEKISLIKALGLAGDITVYGKKDNVLLIREVDGKRKVRRIDMNSSSFLTSPYYYLQPNDVIYVETNKNKLASVSSSRQSTPAIISAIASGLTVVVVVLDRILN